MLHDLHAMASEIGPRGTGTQGERAAADYVAARLAELGFKVERQTFLAAASQNDFPMIIAVLALLAFLIYTVDATLIRWLAAILALITAPLFWQTIRMSGGPLRPLLARVSSSNVVTSIEPRGQVQRRIVVLAHLDTNRCRKAWQSSAVRYLEPLTYLTLAMLSSLGALYLIGALLGGPSWVWWLSVIPAAYMVGTIVTLWRDDQTAYSCGAHDNAGSVAVALEIGARVAAKPLDSTQVLLAFTGAEETDHAGLFALLDKYSAVLSQASFIGLEGIGSGEIVYLTQQGLCDHYRPDPCLQAIAARVASKRPELGVHPAGLIMEDEVGTLRRLGYSAICIAGYDPVTATLPHWHRVDDTAETISADHLERTASFVMALLEEL